MGDYRPKKWPDYALDAYKQNRKLHARIKQAIREAQIAATEGNRDMVIILLADIREDVTLADELLAGAYLGEYK
jgi:hypothetical protein